MAEQKCILKTNKKIKCEHAKNVSSSIICCRYEVYGLLQPNKLSLTGQTVAKLKLLNLIKNVTDLK